MKRLILRALGLMLCVLPPACATLSYFPLWLEKGATHTVSGVCALLLAVCAVPLFRYVRRVWRAPSAIVLWAVLFLLFYVLSRIADEMCVITFTGLVGNVMGAALFRLAKEKTNALD